MKRNLLQERITQASILGPLLFIIVMNEVIKEVKLRTKGVVVGHRKLQHVIIWELMYADDVILNQAPLHGGTCNGIERRIVRICYDS